MSPTRVYLSDVHSPMGYHLVDLFRTDHIDPHSPTVIIGSSSMPPSGPISHTINVYFVLFSSDSIRSYAAEHC
jgi:hypothetical protein